MWEYLAVLIIGFWLGISIFLYISCYWVEEILDLPSVRDGVRTDSDRGPSASGAHARLKRLVNRVIEEAMALPALAHYAQRPQPEPDTDAGDLDARTYEDLLATAILNKVIERYQTESTGGRSGGASSGIHSASASPTPSAPSSSSISPPRSPHTPPLLDDDDDDDHSDSEWEHHDFRGQEVPELPRRVPFPEFGGDIIHCSESTSDLNDQMLAEMSGSDLQAVDGCWEENWLFQKKKVKTLQSVPVPMLVPNPISEYRAMIGDREADDTTDLSDAATDSEEEHEYKSDIGRALQSKTVIGGKTPTEQLLDLEMEIEDKIINKFSDTNKLDRNAESYSNESQNLSNNDLDSSTEIQEVTAEFNSSNDSVVVVGIDSGPLNKAEFAVGEIHRTNASPVAGLESPSVDEIDGFVESKIKSEMNKENTNSLSNHEQEGEYEETITKPVQRYADSLRRQHYNRDNNGETDQNGDFNGVEDDLIPGSIADRERKKWLKCVEMPNNPYSAEAIQKRLNNKGTSALFDFLSTKSNAEDKTIKHQLEMKKENTEVTPPSPSPRILKDVLAEDVPQYKRYGRDYYINEAKRSAGARKLNGASSLCTINKATSLDQFDMNEFTSPVSASSSLSDIEAAALHHNIVRAVLSPRNASPNFAINPIFENPDRSTRTIGSDDYDDIRRIKTDKYNSEKLNNSNNKHAINVSCNNRNINNGDDDFVRNEDIVRLEIPSKAEVTENTFETFGSIRHSGTVRSDVFRPRIKKRTGLNFTFGGSLRLHKNFKSDLW